MAHRIIYITLFLGLINGLYGKPSPSHIPSSNEDMLAESSNLHNYNNGVIEASPLLYHQHSISRSENLNVQPLPSSPSAYSQQYEETNNPAPAAQNFLSTFFRDHQYNPPLGHNLRPYFQAAEPFSTTRSPSSRLNAHRSVVESAPPPRTSAFDQSILGSGDFGVLRGGTFYQDNDPTLFRSSESSNEFSYYSNKNGHGRPQTAAYVQRYTYPEDQFANFRDFADINTPNDAAFSHFVVVYKNRNGTTVEGPSRGERPAKYEPKNILDQLRLLDEETERSTKASKSKVKAKLRRTKLTRKYTKAQFPKEDRDQDEGDLEAPATNLDQIADPLLALS